MLLPRIIPVLLMTDSGLVKTVQFENARYLGDVVNAVHIFNQKAVDELVILDITGNKPDISRVQAIADECFFPFAYGGGITTVDEVRQIIRNGCEKVIINSAAFTHPALVTAASEAVGSQAVAVGIDYRQNQVYINHGRTPTGIDPVTYALKAVGQGCGEIFLQSIERDGAYQGYDLGLIRELSALCPVPLTVCGGCGRIEHMREALDCGATAVAAGSMFVFHGKQKAVLISYPVGEEKDFVQGRVPV